MKQIKRAILPMLTVVIVLGTILLPGQLSKWKDQALMSRVHREECVTGMNLPNYSLSMEERLDLYTRDQSGGGITVMTQVLTGEELDEVEDMVRQELDVFDENGFLPKGAYEELLQIMLPKGEQRYGTRLYLQDEETHAATRVTTCEILSKRTNTRLWITLDEETGHMIAFELTYSDTSLQRPAREFAEFFMSHLGVPYEVSWESKDGYAVETTIPGYHVTYNFNFLESEWGYVGCRPYCSELERRGDLLYGDYADEEWS